MLKKMLPLLVVLLTLSLSAAAAEPALTDGKYVSYIGEENFLFLLNEQNELKVLRTPVSDLISMKEGVLYCLTQGGLCYGIPMDGNSPVFLYSSNLTAEEEARVLPVLSYSMEGGALLRRTEENQNGLLQTPLSTQALMAAANAQYLYYAEKADGENTTVKRLNLQQAGTFPETLAALQGTPMNMTLSSDQLAFTFLDGRVAVLALAGGQPDYRLSVPGTEAAAAVGTRLFRYQVDDDGHYTLLSQENLMTMDEAKGYVNPMVTASPAPTAYTTAAPYRTYAPTATPRRTAVPTATPRYDDYDDGNIYFGARGSTVRRMQNRLIALGYPLDKADGVYGENTASAVRLFQHAIGYRERNYITAKALTKLYQRNAPVYDACMPLAKGDRGEAVLLMQITLKDKGFDPGKLDGIYGDKTVSALKKFQQSVGLKATGDATRETLMALYEEDQPLPPPTQEPVVTDPPVTPTDAPTAAPTTAPTDSPTAGPSEAPTEGPTEAPTAGPTEAPTEGPTEAPTEGPTEAPTEGPTEAPTDPPADPTAKPTDPPAETTPASKTDL